MSALVPAFQAGNLLAVHGAGLTNSTRSHFDAQRYIEVGKAADPNLVTGWLGRHLATSTPMRTDAPLRALGIAGGMPRTLVGAPKALPIPNPSTFGLGGDAATRTARAQWLRDDYSTVDTAIGAPALDALNTVNLLTTIDFNGYRPAGGATYPTSSFGRGMRATAALIKATSASRPSSSTSAAGTRTPRRIRWRAACTAPCRTWPTRSPHSMPT